MAQALVRALLRGWASREFVSLVERGLPVSPQEEAWLPEPTAELSRQISSWADVLPPLRGAWSPRGASLCALYSEWLRSAQFPSPALSEAEASQHQQARATMTGIAPTYEAHAQHHARVKAALEEARRERKDLRTLLPLQAELQRATVAWEALGRKTAYETARATVDHFALRGFSSAHPKLRAGFEAALGGAWQPGACAPATLTPLPADPVAAWTSLSLDARSGRGEECGVDGGGPLPELWVQHEGGAPEAVGAAGGQLSISIEWLRSVIDRSPWFGPELLLSRAWCWPGATRRHPRAGGRLFSDGRPPPHTLGDWPLLPVAFVFARRVTLVGDSTALTEFVSRAAAAQHAGVWIFPLRRAPAPPLSGCDFHRRGPNELESDAISLIAVISSPMPAEPDPDLTLLPDG